ncbi:hypothetical protein Nmel_000050, partial [Mimus melanotis]
FWTPQGWLPLEQPGSSKEPGNSWIWEFFLIQSSPEPFQLLRIFRLGAFRCFPMESSVGSLNFSPPGSGIHIFVGFEEPHPCSTEILQFLQAHPILD